MPPSPGPEIQNQVKDSQCIREREIESVEPMNAEIQVPRIARENSTDQRNVTRNRDIQHSQE